MISTEYHLACAHGVTGYVNSMQWPIAGVQMFLMQVTDQTMQVWCGNSNSGNEREARYEQTDIQVCDWFNVTHPSGT